MLENYLSESVNDTHERFCFQGCATDQTTVNIRFCKQLGCVRRLTAAAIKYRAIVSYLITVLFSDDTADKCMHLFSLIVCSGLASSNCPNRLISKYDFTEIFSRKVKESLFYLLFNNIKICSILTQKIGVSAFSRARPTFTLRVSDVSP